MSIALKVEAMVFVPYRPSMVLYHYTVSCLIFWVAEKIMKSQKYFLKKIM
jgi:hypothetical protein